MNYAVIWFLFGGLIGIAAAQKRGWNPAAGFVGGGLLGLLSPLLFLVSGVTRSDRSKVCPNCAEHVKAQARICRYCHSTVA